MRRNAFTLIEVSIAVFILAMLVAVSVPGFIRSYNDLTLREAARTFGTMCQFGRVQAVQHHAPAVLHLDLDHQAFWLTQSLSSDEGEKSDTTLKTYRLTTRVVLAAAERGDETGKGERLVNVTFYPNGTCDSVSVIFRGVEKGGLGVMLDPITCRATTVVLKQ